MEKVEISTEYINLSRFLKLVGIAQTGGQVKELLDDKQILVNGVAAFEKRKKLRPGDKISVFGNEFEIAGEILV